MEGVLVIKKVSVKLFSFFNGGSIGDQENVCQTLELLYWREYWWSRTCLSNSSASLMEGVLVIKNVSVKLFSFFNGGSIGDEGLVCQTLQFLRWRQYWWSRTCLSNSSASSMEGVLVMKNVSAKFYSFFNGGSIGDEERVCQTLQFLRWRQYWWSRTCLSISSVSSMEGVLVMKNVSVKLQLLQWREYWWSKRVCPILQLLQRREYWWWRTCLSNSSVSSVEAVLVIKNVEGVLVMKNVSVKLQLLQWREYWWSKRVCPILQLLQRREYWWWRTCLSNSSVSSVEAVLVIKNVSVNLFSFINGGSIGDEERVCQTLHLLQWREYWWSKRVSPILQLLQRREYWWWRTCLSNSSVSSVEAVLVIKNVSVKLFSFFNGGSIGDEELVCQTLQFLRWRQYWWSRTCLSNSSASSMEGVLVMKNFCQINGGSIGDEERVCQTLQFLRWRQYWWSRTCLSISSVSSMEGVLVMKNVSVKLFSFFNGGSIGDQNVSVNFTASSTEGVLVMKNVSVKLFSFFSGGSIGDQERVCQTLQFHQWREYWRSKRVCPILQLLQEGVLVMKNVSVKLFSFFSGGSIGDQERVCQTLQLHQWREYWWSRTCLSNSSASLLEGVLVIMNVSVKLFNFFNGGSIGNQEFVCQTLELLYWREYWWSRTCLSNSSASLMQGVLVIKNVSVKLFSFFNGGSIGDEGRVCQTLQFLRWRQYWWWRTCLSNSSASSMEGVLVMKNVYVKNSVCQTLQFLNGGSIGDQENVCQTLELLYWREYWWSRTCLSKFQLH